MKSTFNRSYNRTINKTSTESSNNIIQKSTYNIYEEPNFMSIFSNISMKQMLLISKYCDMSYVVGKAENAIVLARPIKVWPYPKDHEEYNNSYEDAVLFTRQHFKKNISESHKLDARVATREILFNNIRQLYPSFGLDIEKKISQDDYKTLSTEKGKLRSFILYHPIYNDKVHPKEALLQRKDILYAIIDTPEFTKACDIQDNFLLSEINTFFEHLHSADSEQKRKFNKKTIKLPNGEKTSTVELAEKAKQKALSRTRKYSELFELYKKLNIFPYGNKIHADSSELEEK